jgi:hypothetical protein
LKVTTAVAMTVPRGRRRECDAAHKEGGREKREGAAYLKWRYGSAIEGMGHEWVANGPDRDVSLVCRLSTLQALPSLDPAVSRS